MNRRQFITTTGTVTTAILASETLSAAQAKELTLAPLPYAFDALAPHIDAKTMEIHHGKHHQAYVTNLNKALAELKTLESLELAALQKLPGSEVGNELIRTAIRNNGGGHYNHDLFWKLMGKPGTKHVGGEAGGKVGEKIKAAFGSFKEFQTKFAEAGMKRFGSGWAWLIQKPDGTVAITSTPNQDNPLMTGIVPADQLGTPLLGLDVWEHAYYLNYQNRRADYITAWWNVVNWGAVEERLTK
jgi:Fe-Mn family superoxide dismutase